MATAAKQLHVLACILLILCLAVFTAVAEAWSTVGAADVANEGPKTMTATGTENPVVTTTWCIAKPSTDSYNLQLDIEECCKYPQVDCSVIKPGGICYEPDNQVSHASVVMNLYYKAFGKNTWNCYFTGTGIIVTQDPSVGRCVYPA